MDNTGSRFDYRPRTKGYKLLGALMITMSPLVLWMSFQGGDGDLVLGSLGTFRGPAVPWIIRGIALILIWSGFSIFRAGSSKTLEVMQVVLTSSGISLPGKEIPYSSISGVSTTDGKDGKVLTVRHTGGRTAFYSAQMSSTEDFNRLVGLLQERTVT